MCLNSAKLDAKHKQMQAATMSHVRHHTQHDNRNHIHVVNTQGTASSEIKWCLHNDMTLGAQTDTSHMDITRLVRETIRVRKTILVRETIIVRETIRVREMILVRETQFSCVKRFSCVRHNSRA